MDLLAPQSSSFALNQLPRAPLDGLYVHIPFCFHKCHYCDFYSITNQSPQRMDGFVDTLLREAELWTHSDAPAIRPRTIFFGGGTPSLLPINSMRRLLIGLRDRLDLSQVDEWTCEINPATADYDYCLMLREQGVTRLSFGGQSFDRGELTTLERHHDPEDVPRSIELARRAGFSRLNVDLIFAIPGQTMATWNQSLDAVLSLRTPHISCYALTYEPNTPLFVKRQQGKIQPMDESLELEMLSETRRRLGSAGYRAYEISNFAVPGEQCRHNLLYWAGGSYAGLGPSASSHAHGWRWKNKPHLLDWERGINSGAPAALDVECLSVEQRIGEYAMLRLRLDVGIDYAEFSACWGCDARIVFADPIARFGRQGLLIADDRGIRLSDSGVRLADAIAAEFLTAARPSSRG